jgi:hypothetical protein
MTGPAQLPPDVTAAITLQALAAGKPPDAGGAPFFFGRSDELGLLRRDLNLIGAGSSVLRIVVGELGAGKSALLHEHMRRARRERFATMRAEFARECLLYGRTGEGTALIEQALLDLKTLGSGERCAIDAIIGSFADQCHEIATERGCRLDDACSEQLAPLGELPRGHDFVRVITTYVRALDAAQVGLQQKLRCWLLAQSTEAPVKTLVPPLGDDDFWNVVKLWAAFVRIAGRPGLVVVLDEARLLSDVLSGPSRNANYARLRGIYDEVSRGAVAGLGLCIAATPDLLANDHNGLASEPGLASRLRGKRSISKPTDLVTRVAFKISNLGRDDLEQLLLALRDLIGRNRPDARLIPRSDVSSFLEQSRDRLGGEDYPLVDDLIHGFIEIHNRLNSNPNLQWSDLLQGNPKNGQSVAAIAAESGRYAERTM